MHKLSSCSKTRPKAGGCMLSNVLMGLGIWNIIVLTIYGYDKFSSKMSYWRVPEFNLILLAFLMGGTGAILGMFMCNHKIGKWKFRILVPLAFICNAFLFGYGLYYWSF